MKLYFIAESKATLNFEVSSVELEYPTKWQRVGNGYFESAKEALEEYIEKQQIKIGQGQFIIDIAKRNIQEAEEMIKKLDESL